MTNIHEKKKSSTKKLVEENININDQNSSTVIPQEQEIKPQETYVLVGEEFTKKYNDYYSFFLQYKAKSTNIKGFRVNKVPLNLIAITYNQELSDMSLRYIVEECVQEIKKTYENIKIDNIKVEEEKLTITFTGYKITRDKTIQNTIKENKENKEK